jgi:hypothetical protein
VDSHGDGSCFFHSVAMALAGRVLSVDEQKEEAEQLRWIAFEYFQNHQLSNKRMNAMRIAGQNANFADATFLNPSAYATDIQITSLASALGLEIVILQYTSNVFYKMINKSYPLGHFQELTRLHPTSPVRMFARGAAMDNRHRIYITNIVNAHFGVLLPQIGDRRA